MQKETHSPLLSRPKLYIVSKHLAVFFACFALAFFIGSLTLISGDSSADTSDLYFTDVAVDIAPVIALNVDTQLLSMDLTPSAGGRNTHASLVTSVSTNNQTGYTLNMSTDTEATGLAHTNNASTNTIPSTTSPSIAPLPTNTWGYNANEGNATPQSTTDFKAIPALSTAETIGSSQAPVTDHPTNVTIGARANTEVMSGTYQNTLVFTAVTNYVPVPPEFFKFTIDTRMTDTIYNPETDTPENNPAHFAGTETTFTIPTRTHNSYNYEWVIDWGDGTPLQEVSGTSSRSNAGIFHQYAEPNEYQITVYSDGEPTAGWLNAWGNYSGVYYVGACGSDSSYIYAFKTIDSTITKLMKNTGEHRFWGTFMNMPNATGIPEGLFNHTYTSDVSSFVAFFSSTFNCFAENSTTASIPIGLFDSIDTSGATTTRQMFMGTFNSYARNSSRAMIPTGLFDSIDTSKAREVSSMFYSTFAGYAQNSSEATIPSGLFDTIDFSGATNISEVFVSTFFGFGPRNVNSATTEIVSIWGDINFAGKLTQENICGSGIFMQIFYDMTSLIGSAQSFIDSYLNGIIPAAGGCGSFWGTNISDYDELDPNWH